LACDDGLLLWSAATVLAVLEFFSLSFIHGWMTDGLF
jgi:hypothetical protein